MTGRVVVVKLGSSVLPDEDALPDVVRALYAAVRAGDRVVAVVSALGRHTDALVDRARAFGPAPSARATAALVATGEATAVALVALALDRAGIPVVPLAGAGIVTAGDPLDGDPVRVDPTAIRAALDRAPIVVVPGFVARDVDGAPSLLGRGGSDLTALLVAEALGATCRLVKDVGGVYDADPRVAGAVRY
ncbi:MAG: homoserine dehydrogenase, partial [Myxococcota bacterium]